MYPTSRLLINPDAADAEGFLIRTERGGVLCTFRTGGVNGKSARDTALVNLMDVSEWVGGKLTLYVGPLLPVYSNGSTAIAEAEFGCGAFLAV